MPRTRGGSLLRFGLGALIVVGCVAVSVTTFGLLKINTVVGDLRHHHPIAHLPGVGTPGFGKPETIFLVGSDHRASDPGYRNANTDTMLLLRLNSASSTINVVSIPRDLEVQIPEGGTTVTGKLNSAYSVGGPALLLKIIRTQVFPGFHVNHVIDVNFAGFSDLIDAIGCVYADVDHRYFNASAPGIDNYSSIDIQPGYQKLCGDDQADTGALAFVRFRHTDSDIVRNSRQQDFIRWAKQNYTSSQLITNYEHLAKIFGAHAQMDASLQTDDGLQDLVELLATSAGHALKSIPFPAQFSQCNAAAGVACYVTSTSSAEAAAYRAFMTPTTAAAPSAVAATPRTGSGPSQTGGGSHASSSGLVADTHDGILQAEALGRSGLPVYYPKYLLGPDSASTIGSQYCSSITGNCDDPSEPASEYIHSFPRQYVIHGTGAGVYKSYVMTFVLNGGLGYYYTVQGTTWQTPPILRSAPTQTQTVDGRTLLEYFNGTGKLSLVAWRTPKAVYWVSNTLTDYIPPGQMKALAASLTLERP